MASILAHPGKSDNKASPISNPSSWHKSEPQKLRASCDGCYISKVKCSKETPACSRCAAHGIPCKYSPSQRMGKPRRLQSNAVEPDFQFPSSRNELDTRSLNNGLMQAPLSDWLVDPSIAPPDIHSNGNSNDDPTAWHPGVDAGFTNFDPESRSDTDSHQMMSPADSVSCSTLPPFARRAGCWYHKAGRGAFPHGQHVLLGETHLSCKWQC